MVVRLIISTITVALAAGYMTCVICATYHRSDEDNDKHIIWSTGVMLLSLAVTIFILVDPIGVFSGHSGDIADSPIVTITSTPVQN